MPRPSLRRAGRSPKPGAAGCGCPRPKALRFAASLGASPFGDGTYSGNIVQGGVVLQPQPYLLNGELLPDCIVVTGAATVAPDPNTGAAAFQCRNLVINGGSLAASVKCRGLVGFVRGRTALLNGAALHMNGLGAAGAFGGLAPCDLLPPALRARLPRGPLLKYAVCAIGAAGAAGQTGGNVTGNTGAAAAAMQTGGGGSGAACNSSGAGGAGGPCCGGAGSGGGNGTAAAGANGGPGSAGAGSYQEAGGGGDPAGAGVGGAGAGKGPGGGLLMLFSAAVAIASGCVVSADGSAGGDSGYGRGGGGTGGGCVVLVTKPGLLANNGTARASGGLGGAGASGAPGGPGGPGSVNIFTIQEAS